MRGKCYNNGRQVHLAARLRHLCFEPRAHARARTRTHGEPRDVFSPPSSLSLSFCSARQVNENNKTTLCISSAPSMASSIYCRREMLKKKGNTNKMRKKQGGAKIRRVYTNKKGSVSYRHEFSRFNCKQVQVHNHS